MAPSTPAPKPTCGECGSPSTSEYAWCLRWSETHCETGPCVVIAPRIASTARIQSNVSKLLWVK